MKLDDLFNNNPINFQEEDITTLFLEDNRFDFQPLQHQQVDFNVAYSRPVGTYNGKEIWGSRYFGKDVDLYGILDKQRNILAWSAFDNKSHTGYSTLIRSYVDPTQRGKDLTLTIINFLVTKANEKIWIDKDEPTSKDSRKLIGKWFQYPIQKRHFNMKFFDSSGEIAKPNTNQILQGGIKNDVYIILEDCLNMKMPRYGGIGKRILMDNICY